MHQPGQTEMPQFCINTSYKKKVSVALLYKKEDFVTFGVFPVVLFLSGFFFFLFEIIGCLNLFVNNLLNLTDFLYFSLEFDSNDILHHGQNCLLVIRISGPHCLI